jgi:hypothetical protein
MRLRRLSYRALVVAALAAMAAPLRAQAVLGLGEDATTVPAGSVRIGLLNTWSRFDKQYDVNGTAQPLGAPFALEAWGSRQLESLSPLESGLRALTGIPDLSVSLGRLAPTFNAQTTVTPLTVELGLASRLSLGVLVPWVHTHVDATFIANPRGNEGNVGLNPALTGDDARNANAAFFSGFTAANQALGAKIASCQANPASDPACGSVLANGPAALTQASDLELGLLRLYGNDTCGQEGGVCSPFVPVATSPADAAIRSRIDAFRTQYGQFGIASFPAQGPSGAFELSSAEAERLIADPQFGIRSDSLDAVDRWGIGDVEVSAKLQWLNTLGANRLHPKGFHVRSAATVVLRLGTGKPEAASNFIDIGTGDGQNDVEVRSQNDLIFGKRFWASFVGRYGWQRPDKQMMRIASFDEPLAPFYRTETVQRDLGDYYEVEATPRWVINDYFGISLQYLYRHKAADKYSGIYHVTNLLGADTVLDAAVLDTQTELTEQRASLGFAFSTLAAFSRGRARLPLEISYQHLESVAGSGGRTPKYSQDVVRMRVYVRLWGGDSRARYAR